MKFELAKIDLERDRDAVSLFRLALKMYGRSWPNPAGCDVEIQVWGIAALLKKARTNTDVN